jgi:hypothetical protein
MTEFKDKLRPRSEIKRFRILRGWHVQSDLDTKYVLENLTLEELQVIVKEFRIVPSDDELLETEKGRKSGLIAAIRRHPVRYAQGETVENHTDLCARHNPRNAAGIELRSYQKYECLDPSAGYGAQVLESLSIEQLEAALAERKKKEQAQEPVATQAAGESFFDAMTVDDLKRYAAEEEIDLGKARSKDDIVKVLKGAKQTA